MSAYIVGKVHIDLLVDTAFSGPSKITVEPGYWDGVRWWSKPLVYVAKEAREAYREGGYEAYSRAYQEYQRDIRHTDPDTLGRLLWTENLRSVAARYPDDGDGDRPGSGDSDDEIAAYTFEPRGYRLTVSEALGAINCLSYQSCEHDDWLESEACQFLDAFTSALVGKIADGWSWDEEDLAKARQRKLLAH